jgi:hypothetical protein
LIDGHINFAPDDWDSNEVAVSDSPSDSKWGGNEIDSVLVTWDADSLYIGYIYVVNSNAMIVFIDAGTGIGDADVNNLDWYPRNFRFSDAQAEVIIAGWDAGTPGVRRIVGDGQTNDMSARCRIANSAQSGVLGAAEVAIPWDAIYELGEGNVLPGVSLKVVAVIAGGDNWGGCDSAPDNAGVDGGGGPVTLSNFFLALCDLDSDGLPDEGFPPSGAISGTVTLSNSEDSTTVVSVTAFESGTATVVGSAVTPEGGGSFRIANLFDGGYDILFEAPSYVGQTLEGIVVSGGQETGGSDATLQYVSGKITGRVVFAEGTGALIDISAYESGTTTLAGTSPVKLGPPGGDFTISVLPDGDYDLVVTATGYITIELPLTISGGGTANVDTLALYTVRATRFTFVNSIGDSIFDALGTVSLPDSGIYLYVPVFLEARDSLGRLDFFDLGGFRDSVFMSYSLLDPSLDPLGDVLVADKDSVELPGGLLMGSAFQNGRANLNIANDVVEVVLLAASPAPSLGYGDPGRMRIGFLPREPVEVVLTVEPDTIEAGGAQKATVRGQLKDASGADSNQDEVTVNMLLLSGEGTLSPFVTTTDTNGEFEVEFHSTAAGLAVISDSIDFGGRKLGTNSVSVTVLPGPAASVQLSSQYSSVYSGLRFGVAAQIADEFGNEVKEAGVSVTLSSSPSEKLTELTTPVTTDASGHASGFATAAESYGTVEIAGTSPYEVRPVTISIEADLVAVDEPAPEDDPLHHSLVGMDLTGLHVRLEDDSLKLHVPFLTDWDQAHLVVILETFGDGSGLEGDAFRFPVVFDHALRPDFIFTDKFKDNSDTDTGNDYADFRRWAGPGVDSFWDLVAQGWITDASNPDKNAAPWTRHDGSGLDLHIPASVLGLAVGDSLRVQVYCTDESGTKRTAFDSCPHDSTLNMEGNWWESAGDTVRLHNYAPVKLVALPEPPVIDWATVSPSPATVGQTVLIAAFIVPAGGGVGDVTADLSPIGGSAVQTLHDDGTNGDTTAGDQVYSYAVELTESAPGGIHPLTVTARDASNRSKSTLTPTLEITGELVLVRSFEDAPDDDHGPNQGADPSLYYRYPTNPVFHPGSFDIREVEIIDEGDWIDFRVVIGELTSPDEPNAADWNATYPPATVCRIPERVDLNMQNLIIFIDSEKGGATTALPNRYADIARWDAWEYALVAEGWWKGVLASNGSNDLFSWTKHKADTEFWFCTNHVDNSLDLHVSKEVLGNPTEEVIRDWDIIAIMSGHDGDSNDENFGSLRWVNEGSPSEWQFGGGLNGEGGRERDANIIDVAVSAGEGKTSGKSQEEMLDYTADDANARFRDGEMAVVLEATAFQDFAPPAISSLPSNGKAVTGWFAMENAPLVIGTDITDDDEVTEASLKWRPLRGTFSEPVGMSHLLRDLWVADLDFSDLSSAVPHVEGKLYFELQISARDPSDNASESRLFTVEVDTLRSLVHVLEDIARFTDPLSGHVILQGVPDVIPDGSALMIPEEALEDSSKVYDLILTSLGNVDLSQLPPETGSFTGVARTFEMISRDSGETEGIGPPVTETAVPFSLLLHYPAYVLGNSDPRGLSIYRWQDETYRWVLLGGNASSSPGLVGVSTSSPGTFALFSGRFRFDNDKILSAVTISPNPFSPNRDGLYEETHISFYLQKPTNVLIEIYDLAGQLVRRFDRRYYEELGRIEGETWDGTDSEGNVVPYGIYIMRFEAAIPDEERSERFNEAVVVIK